MIINLTTEFIGKNIIKFDEIASTQLEAKKREKYKEIPNGTLFVTKKQIAGIGTHDRTWYMGQEDNIAMTMVLYPQGHIGKFDNLTLVIAQCMIQAIEELYQITLQIKKPNDIVYHHKKIGGILTETVVSREIVKYLYIGIGLNVNQIDFPSELIPIATSLKKEFHKNFNSQDIIIQFCNIFEKEYKKILK